MGLESGPYRLSAGHGFTKEQWWKNGAVQERCNHYSCLAWKGGKSWECTAGLCQLQLGGRNSNCPIRSEFWLAAVSSGVTGSAAFWWRGTILLVTTEGTCLWWFLVALSLPDFALDLNGTMSRFLPLRHLSCRRGRCLHHQLRLRT